LSGKVLAELDGVTAGYGGRPAIEGVSFQVRAGERVGVLGPNGGGKSTLFKVMLGVLPNERGSVRVDSRCGFVPQSDRSRLDYPVSALDVVLMGALGRLPWWRRPGRGERRRAIEALELVGLESLAQHTFGELSGGQRQRVLIARALMQEAGLLLLDEPFSGIDTASSRRVMAVIDQLADRGHGLMIATHDIDQARAWGLVLCLNRRQVAFGPADTTLTRPVLEETHGAALVRLPSVDGGEREDAETALVPPHHHQPDEA
jgi:ABC-type Mn2+/Zn2+ transport system ATPase subunit